MSSSPGVARSWIIMCAPWYCSKCSLSFVLRHSSIVLTFLVTAKVSNDKIYLGLGQKSSLKSSSPQRLESATILCSTLEPKSIWKEMPVARSVFQATNCFLGHLTDLCYKGNLPCPRNKCIALDCGRYRRHKSSGMRLLNFLPCWCSSGIRRLGISPTRD